MSGSTDSPTRVIAVADCLDIGSRGRFGAAAAYVDGEGMLGVIDDIEGHSELLAQPADERRDRPASAADHGVVLPVTTTWAVMVVLPSVPSPPRLCSSWLTSVCSGSGDRYSVWKASHITPSVISVPESSVMMCWIVARELDLHPAAGRIRARGASRRPAALA